jgi:hypothetical protein
MLRCINAYGDSPLLHRHLRHGRDDLRRMRRRSPLINTS